jgi:gluconolactonase
MILLRPRFFAALAIAAAAAAPLPANDPDDPAGIFLPGTAWETVGPAGTRYEVAEGIACAADGTVYFTDVPAAKLFKVAVDGAATLLDDATGGANGLALGPDGQLYGAASKGREIVAWNLASGGKQGFAGEHHANDLAIRADGKLFFTCPPENAVFLADIRGRGPARKVGEVDGPNGIALSADGRTLFVAQFRSDAVWAFDAAEDGSLSNKREGFKLQIEPGQPGLLDGMCFAADGTFLIGTRLGLQVLRPGAKAPVLVPKPADWQRANYVRIGGPGGAWLYVAHCDRVVRRQTLLRPAAAP